ncbi:MAG: hypothetical protein WKG07_01150 [Hymenobacter sp.]
MFRIFDSLNWLKGMEVLHRLRAQQNRPAWPKPASATPATSSTPSATKYTLDYYLKLAKQLEDAGAHILCIKDMAGLLKPYAATELIAGLRDAVKLPIHLHTHDTQQPASRHLPQGRGGGRERD